MPLFGKRDEVKELAKEAERRSKPSNKPGQFDLGRVIECLTEALRLKPDNLDYRRRLTWAYLTAPECAVVYGSKMKFDLRDSAELALRVCERGRRSSQPTERKHDEDLSLEATEVYAHLCLGEEQRAREKLMSWCRMASGKNPDNETLSQTLRALHASMTRGTVDGQPVCESMHPELELSCLSGVQTLLGAVVDFFIEAGAKGLEESVGDTSTDSNTRWVLLQLVYSMDATQAQPEAAKAHIEQAMRHRDKGNPEKAMDDIMEARRVAPDVAWLYQAICDIANRG